MSIGGIVPGWLIGYLVSDDGEICEYRTLSVVSLIANPDGSVEPVVMTPSGQALRADAVPFPRAFAVGPDEDSIKAAHIHAASRGPRKVRPN